MDNLAKLCLERQLQLHQKVQGKGKLKKHVQDMSRKRVVFWEIFRNKR